MRIDLPSGGWIEIRDRLKAGDMAVQNAVSFTVEDGKVSQAGGVTDAVTKALLARIITGWSLEEQGIPIPDKHVAGVGILDELDIDDYNALRGHEVIEELRQKVSWSPPNQPKPSAS